MQNIYETFEFNLIKEEIYNYAKTERAKEEISSLLMFEDISKLKKELEELKETMSLIQRYGEMPISPSLNAIRLIEEAKKSGLLTPRELSMIAEDAITSHKIKTFLKKVEVAYPLLKDIVDGFIDLSNLEKEIHRVISSSLSIKDDASKELASIRKRIIKCRDLLEDKMNTIALSYSQYLSDDNITLRDGHLVLPVKTVNKNKVPGIIYDVSDSGNTTFIEPLEIVQINNEMTSLRLEENEEIRRILKELTSLVLMMESEVLNNNEIIARLDYLSAKSIYGLEINGVVASISDTPIITFDKARHPLIDKKKVVANSYHLDEKVRIIIISGPNAGGKTVSLKTVGLLTLMNQCGLPVPCEKAILSYFNHIYIDIGDNQSLSDNLSTFSAHMSHLSEIVGHAKGKDLVIIDELGTGTDPKEGEALAFAITKYLERKHAFALISSHFDALKEYAFVSENIDNSSMLFNEKELVPTYIFRQGIPGKSYALDVANRYGIKEEIVEEAREFLKSKGENQSDELISALLNKINEAAELERKLKAREEELAKKEKQYETDRRNLEEKRERLLKDVQREKEEIIRKAKEQIDDILSMLNKSDLKLHEIIELKKEIEELEESEEVVEFNEELQVGDYVSYPSLELSGKIISIKGNKAKITSDNGFTFEANLSNLTKIDEPKESKTKKKPQADYEANINTSMSLELNIIGMRTDEAKDALIKYLDNCRLKHLTQVRIIHGYGSGALRKMVHAYLDTQKDLTYRPGGEHEGGGGATVVLFKS